MEVTCGAASQFSALMIGSKRIRRKPNMAVVPLNQREIKECVIKICDLSRKGMCRRQRRFDFRLSHSSNHSQVLESGNLCAAFNEDWLLKNKAQEVASCLNGRSIFLLGMMGSGKTTVGRVLSEALGYSFVDSWFPGHLVDHVTAQRSHISGIFVRPPFNGLDFPFSLGNIYDTSELITMLGDAHVEQAMSGTSVAQIFKQRGESFFRDHESEALRKLSLVPRQVVATGGGVVVRPINWKFMRQGITVYLDVPLDALARRIAAVGTDSRPLLHFDSGDAYTTAFVGLFTLTKKRSEAYADADTTVSLLDLAANLHLEDVSDITPTAIAIEVLVQIEEFLLGENGRSLRMYP